MKTSHYSEADLLETYYMTPDEASPLIAHVNGCPECQERYQRLSRKLREIAACPTEKPATFWARQRLMIMRAVERAGGRSHRPSRVARIATAAIFIFILGGVTVYETMPRKTAAVAVSPAQSQVATTPDDLQIPRDPWNSEELKGFGSVVEWQSWVTQTNEANGDDTL